MRSIAVRLGIVAAFVIGVVVLRPFLTGSAGDLRVGDCFDRPTAVEDTVEDVQHRPCTDHHTAEVVFVGEFEGGGQAIPTNDEFRAYVEGRCIAAFDEYSGLDFVTDPTYDMSAFTPTVAGWADGDRTVICYAVRWDGAVMTESIRRP